MDKTKEIALVDMERRLLSDKTGEYRRNILKKLDQFLAEIKSKLSAGVPPDEFTVLSKIQEAIRSAHDIIANF